MLFEGLMNKVGRVQYAIEAVENLHGGEDCPEEDGYCENCDTKIIAVHDRIMELPWVVRVFMWMSSPRSAWEFWQDVKGAKLAMVEREELRSQ